MNDYNIRETYSCVFAGVGKPRLSPPPALLPLRCVISLAAALLVTSNPSTFPPEHEFWLSGEHEFRTGLLFCKQAATRTRRASSAPLMRTAGMLFHTGTPPARGNRRDHTVSGSDGYHHLATGWPQAFPKARACASPPPPPAGVLFFFPPFTSMLNSTCNIQKSQRGTML